MLKGMLKEEICVSIAYGVGTENEIGKEILIASPDKGEVLDPVFLPLT